MHTKGNNIYLLGTSEICTLQIDTRAHRQYAHTRYCYQQYLVYAYQWCPLVFRYEVLLLHISQKGTPEKICQCLHTVKTRQITKDQVATFRSNSGNKMMRISKSGSACVPAKRTLRIQDTADMHTLQDYTSCTPAVFTPSATVKSAQVTQDQTATLRSCRGNRLMRTSKSGCGCASEADLVKFAFGVSGHCALISVHTLCKAEASLVCRYKLCCWNISCKQILVSRSSI